MSGASLSTTTSIQRLYGFSLGPTDASFCRHTDTTYGTISYKNRAACTYVYRAKIFPRWHTHNHFMYGVATHVREEKNIEDRIICIIHEKKNWNKKTFKKKKKIRKKVLYYSAVTRVHFFHPPTNRKRLFVQ